MISEPEVQKIKSELNRIRLEAGSSDFISNIYTNLRFENLEADFKLLGNTLVSVKNEK